MSRAKHEASSVVDGYVRVSRTRGRSGESFISPLDQREAIERLAAREGLTVGRIFEEYDESGARHDRPKLLDAIGRIERGESAGVLVAMLDRFFRSQLHGLQAIERIRDGGGFFLSADGDIDTRDQQGDMLLGIRLAIAQDERRRRTENFASGRRRAVERGIHPSPVPPFGYVRGHDAAGKIVGPLQPDPVTGPLVSELFRRAARAESWAALGRWLESAGARTAYGATSWPARAAKGVVRNRVYLGEARHGEFVHVGAHPPLTDELTFRAAQRAGRLFPPARSEHPALLSGLLRCAGCRHGMQSYWAQGKRQYRCRRKYAAGSCPAPSYVLAEVVEPYVEAAFLDALGPISATPAIESDEKLSRLEAQLRETEAALTVFLEDPTITRELAPADIVVAVRARRAQVDEAERRYLEARADVRAGSLEPVELAGVWADLTVEEKRELLPLVFDAIFLRRGRGRYAPIGPFVHLCLKGEAPADLPRRGVRRGAPIVSFQFEGALGQEAA